MATKNGALTIENLAVGVEGQEILHEVNLVVKKGEIHALMGPNGSGKSTLAYCLMGHPNYEVLKGKVLFKGHNVFDLSPDERARLGLFLAFQYPSEVPGVSVANFLRLALNEKLGKENQIAVGAFRRRLNEKMDLLDIEREFANRYLNQGFSGGEKKRHEVLQMAVLEPEIAILDEVDSGLDIDGIKTVANGVNALASGDMGILIITHYQRILNYITPDFVHVMINGSIRLSGGRELALELEAKGYDWLKDESQEKEEIQ